MKIVRFREDSRLWSIQIEEFLLRHLKTLNNKQHKKTI